MGLLFFEHQGVDYSLARDQPRVVLLNVKPRNLFEKCTCRKLNAGIHRTDTVVCVTIIWKQCPGQTMLLSKEDSSRGNLRVGYDMNQNINRDTNHG